MPATSGTRYGKGAGHGPAKGFVERPAMPFTPEDTPPAMLDNGDPDEQSYRLDQRSYKRDLRRRMMNVLVNNAEDIKAPAMAQITAADKVLDRLDGKPTASVNMQTTIRRSVQDFTDDELIALAGTEDDQGDDPDGYAAAGTDPSEGGTPGSE